MIKFLLSELEISTLLPIVTLSVYRFCVVNAFLCKRASDPVILNYLVVSFSLPLLDISAPVGKFCKLLHHPFFLLIVSAACPGEAVLG